MGPLQRLLEPHRCGDLERHLRRIHRMVRAIVDRHPAIDNRKPRQTPVVHGFGHPFLHCRNKVAWNGPADHLVLKLEPLAAR